jgi:DNA-binding Lrp family transcriptional regulator
MALPTEDILEEEDRAILNRIQSDFPLTVRPFRSVAEGLGLTEKEVLQRVAKLKQRGIIRRIGGNFVPGKLSYVSTLCAARVPSDRIDAFAEVVNRYEGVTHNYQREGEYNVWFTFIAPSMEDIESHLQSISEETGVERILNLPATDVFKIKAHFDL